MKRFSIFLLVALMAISYGMDFAEAATYKMKIGSVGSDEHPSTPALRDFKKYVEEKSNGQIQVSIHINSVLGGDRQMIEAMQLGTLESAIVGSSLLATFEQKFNIFEFPFLFNSHNAAIKFLDGSNGELLNKEMQKQDVRILAYGVNGFRHIANNRAPIHRPEDMKGLKIRTMENPMHIVTFKLLGANPTPMNFGELYTAMSQKTVDAMEMPISLTYTSKFYEVQKYYSLTGHLYAVAPLCVSEIFFRTLPDDLKKVLLDAGKIYAERERKLTLDEDRNTLKELRAKGMVINELSNAEKAVFKNVTAPVYKQFESKVGRDLLQSAIDANN